MSSGIVHQYTVTLTGINDVAESTPAPVGFVTANANTLIPFNYMVGNKIQSVKVRRTAGTATQYEIHVYRDIGGTSEAWAVYEVVPDALLTWDFATNDLNVEAKAFAPQGLLYVTGQVSTPPGGTANVLVEIAVAQDIAGA